ncbi:MAG: hypothetical protein HN885_00435, partial [Nitrospina sp.]|nr:hypothetical protein [Nitrospina sp.]
MNIITKIKNIFSGEVADVEKLSQDDVVDDMKTISSEVDESNKPFSEPEPVIRKVMRVPALSDDIFPPNDENKVLIKAQPSGSRDQCLFMLNRPLFEGHSWWFPDFESAESSPLAERLFSLDDVASVLVNESTITVT